MIIKLCDLRPNPRAPRFSITSNARVSVSPAGIIEIMMAGQDPTYPFELIHVGTQIWTVEDLMTAREAMSMAWLRLRRTIIQ